MKSVLLTSAFVLMVASDAIAQSDGSYVSIGEYQGALTQTATSAEPLMDNAVTYETLTAPVDSASIATMPIIGDPVTSAPVTVTPVATAPIYQPPPAIPVASTGLPDQEYQADRLAAYDKNSDGKVSASEAIADLAPLAPRTVTETVIYEATTIMQ